MEWEQGSEGRSQLRAGRRRSDRYGLVGGSPAATLLALAAILVLIGTLFWMIAVAAALLPPAAAEVELDLMRRIAGRRTPLLDLAFVELTLLGSRVVGATLLLWLAILLWIHRHRTTVAFLGAVFMGSTMLSAILKPLVGRPRPDTVELLVARPESAAFPSGHGIRALTVYIALAFVIHRISPDPALRWLAWLLAAGTALLVGGSRVYLGVHYPSDVLAGYLLGLAWLVACALLIPPSHRDDRR